jgi:hypothetical protein
MTFAWWADSWRAPAADPAGRAVVSTLFGGIARATGSRQLRPLGAAYDATLHVGPGTPLPGAELFATPGEHRSVVRFSRGFGLPDPLPESSRSRSRSATPTAAVATCFDLRVATSRGPKNNPCFVATAAG